MTEQQNGGAAFPHHIEQINGFTQPYEHRGMTLRDYFAAQVLMTACEDYRPIEAAQLAYAFADAMLEARK